MPEILIPNRKSVTGLNENQILLAIENILASIQPSNSPRITTNGASVAYSTAVAAVRRARSAPAELSPDLHPYIGVRRTGVVYTDEPTNKLKGRMRIELVLRVMGTDEYDVDARLHALEDDVIAAMFSGFAMDPDNVSAAQGGYAHNINLVDLTDEVLDGTSVQGSSVMTWDVFYLRSFGKEVGHTGYNP